MKVEFHCHTVYSKDSLMAPESLLARCRQRGIDRVVVTDHNTIRGAARAKELDPERVIIGEEIMTTGGELLAAFVLEEVPAGLHPQAAIDRLRQQGAFISVSHPFDRFREGSWRRRDLLRILPEVDAIEVYNSRCWLPAFNQTAMAFAKEHQMAGTVGSDAHAAFELGRSVLLIDRFDDAGQLRVALRSATSILAWSPPWFHMASRYATAVKRIRAKT